MASAISKESDRGQRTEIILFAIAKERALSILVELANGADSVAVGIMIGIGSLDYQTPQSMRAFDVDLRVRIAP